MKLPPWNPIPFSSLCFYKDLSNSGTVLSQPAPGVMKLARMLLGKG
jgi:hypothetical protein